MFSRCSKQLVEQNHELVGLVIVISFSALATWYLQWFMETNYS